MEVIRGIYNIRLIHQRAAVTIGNFDGIHLGHQKLLEKLKKYAKSKNIPTLVILFEPQPNEFFARDTIPPRLMRFREKIISLANNQIDYVLCIKFDQNFADLSAESFINEILLNRLQVSYLLVGDDFRFGHKRLGDFDLLKKVTQSQFQIEKMETFCEVEERVSSSRIRKMLETGDMETAKQLLGHPFSMCGRVVHGDKRGRIIGFPTANILLHRQAVPVAGVFAVRVVIAKKNFLGVANVGTRPTVAGTRSLLEVHLFDFNHDIYGHEVEVEFVYKLRDEKRFENIDRLKAQIFLDAEQARHFFEKKLERS